MTNDIKFLNCDCMELIKLYKTDLQNNLSKSRYLSVFIHDFEMVIAELIIFDHYIEIDYFLSFDYISNDIDKLVISEFKKANKNDCDLISSDLTKFEIIAKVIRYIENRYSDVQYISTYVFNNTDYEIELNFKFYLKLINQKAHHVILFETNEKHMESNRVINTLHGGELISCIDVENGGNWNEIFG